VSTKYRSGAVGAPVVLLLAALTSGCASSSDGFVPEGADEDKTLEQNAIKGVMQGLGAIDTNERPVEYKPRAPLVVPPTKALPSPRTAAVADPRFPRNPEDVADEQRRAARDGDKGTDGRIMSPEELARWRMQNGAAGPTSASVDTSRPLKPDELRGQGMANEEAIKRAANPGGRKTLIEPPDQYRKPSPNAPVAAPEEKSSWKPSWLPF